MLWLQSTFWSQSTTFTWHWTPNYWCRTVRCSGVRLVLFCEIAFSVHSLRLWAESLGGAWPTFYILYLCSSLLLKAARSYNRTNSSLSSGVVPAAVKETITCLLLKKPSLDPKDLGSWARFSSVQWLLLLSFGIPSPCLAGSLHPCFALGYEGSAF